MYSSLRILVLQILLLVYLLGSVCSSAVRAQNANTIPELTEGREFYFAIPHCAKDAGEGARGTASVELWVSSKKTTKVFGRCEGLGTTFQVNISPNKVNKIALSEDYMNTNNETVQNLGIHLTSSELVSVTVFVSFRWSGEAYRVIPAVWLGKSYRTLNLYQDETDEIKPSQIIITATQDNTMVTYTPTCNTEKVRKGTVGQIVLNKGQTYLIHNEKRSSYTHIDGDLTGTLIQSDKPIAVISGHTKGAFPRYGKRMLGRPANFMRNMLIDMLLPEELLGTEYVSAPILYNNRYVRNIDPDDIGDLIRFVAIKDNTIIQQSRDDGTGYKNVSKSLKAGEYFELKNMELSAAYKSNFPVLVGHYGKAWRNQFINDAGIDKGDNPENPSRSGCGMMLVLVPKERWSSRAVFHSPTGLDNFMYLTFRSADENALMFDNIPLRSKFGDGIKTVIGTEYSYVAAQVSTGDHRIEGAPFAAYAYGNWDYTKEGFAYGYPTGMNMATPCEDSIVLQGTGACGKINGTALVLPENLECAKFFALEMIADSSRNFFFVSPNDFGAKGNKGTFTLNVEDMRKPAQALVRGITKSGKFVTQWFTFDPQSIVDSVYFDSIRVNCDKVYGRAIVNSKDIQCAAIDNLQLITSESENYGLYEDDKVGNSAKFTLYVKDRKKIAKAVVQAKSISGKIVNKSFSYEPETIDIESVTDTVIINVPKGDTVCKTVQLRNNGVSDLLVKSLSFIGNNTYQLIVNPKVPFDLKSSQSRELEICAIGSKVLFSTTVDILASTECSSLYIATVVSKPAVTSVPQEDSESQNGRAWYSQGYLYAFPESLIAENRWELCVLNYLGETVYRESTLSSDTLNNGVYLSLPRGLYIIQLISVDGMKVNARCIVQ